MNYSIARNLFLQTCGPMNILEYLEAIERFDKTYIARMAMLQDALSEFWESLRWWK